MLFFFVYLDFLFYYADDMQRCGIKVLVFQLKIFRSFIWSTKLVYEHALIDLLILKVNTPIISSDSKHTLDGQYELTMTRFCQNIQIWISYQLDVLDMVEYGWMKHMIYFAPVYIRSIPMVLKRLKSITFIFIVQQTVY